MSTFHDEQLIFRKTVTATITFVGIPTQGTRDRLGKDGLAVRPEIPSVLPPGERFQRAGGGFAYCLSDRTKPAKREVRDRTPPDPTPLTRGKELVIEPHAPRPQPDPANPSPRFDPRLCKCARDHFAAEIPDIRSDTELTIASLRRWVTLINIQATASAQPSSECSAWSGSLGDFPDAAISRLRQFRGEPNSSPTTPPWPLPRHPTLHGQPERKSCSPDSREAYRKLARLRLRLLITVAASDRSGGSSAATGMGGGVRLACGDCARRAGRLPPARPRRALACSRRWRVAAWKTARGAHFGGRGG